MILEGFQFLLSLQEVGCKTCIHYSKIDRLIIYYFEKILKVQQVYRPT